MRVRLQSQQEIAPTPCRPVFSRTDARREYIQVGPKSRKNTSLRILAVLLGQVPWRRASLQNSRTEFDSLLACQSECSRGVHPAKNESPKGVTPLRRFCRSFGAVVQRSGRSLVTREIVGSNPISPAMISSDANPIGRRPCPWRGEAQRSESPWDRAGRSAVA